jgi:hypothetical protein
MKDKDAPMVKYGVKESELTLVKTAGREDVVAPSDEYSVAVSDKRVNVPWLKKKAAK